MAAMLNCDVGEYAREEAIARMCPFVASTDASAEATVESEAQSEHESTAACASAWSVGLMVV